MCYELCVMRMTFNIPEKVAKEFQFLVSPGDRSGLLTGLLQIELARRRGDLIRACQAASSDADVEKVVKEWQGFDEKVEGELW